MAFNTETEKCIMTLWGTTGGVQSVCVSPDSTTMYSGSWDNTVKAWKFPTPPKPLMVLAFEAVPASHLHLLSDRESRFGVVTRLLLHLTDPCLMVDRGGNGEGVGLRLG